MTLIAWQNEFSVGDEAIDYEHRQMIDLINSIYDEIGERKDVSSIERLLGDVHAEISAHFALEERTMRRNAYVEFSQHKDHHEELLDQIRELMDRIQSDPESGIPLLKERLANWFRQHFSTFDARLHGKL